MISAMHRTPIRLLAYCLMPNHWHMVLWPGKDGEITQFLRWLTITHRQRRHANRHTTGYGHQGRFKSSPIERAESLLNVMRYVERNALRANLVGGRRIGAGAVYGEDLMGTENRCSAAGLLMRQLGEWRPDCRRARCAAEVRKSRHALQLRRLDDADREYAAVGI